jgi:hypothetical protein
MSAKEGCETEAIGGFMNNSRFGASGIGDKAMSRSDGTEGFESGQNAIDGLRQIDEIGAGDCFFERGSCRNGADPEAGLEGGRGADAKDFTLESGFTERKPERASDEANADNGNIVHAARPTAAAMARICCMRSEN